MRQPASVLNEWIIAVQQDSHDLTQWEADFIDSLSAQFEQRKSMSERQEEILERIYAEKTR